VVAEALHRGHDVTGVARNIGRFDELPVGVTPRAGDARNVDDVAELSVGQDVVISATRPTPGHEHELVAVARALLNGIAGSEARLLLVGGAEALRLEAAMRGFTTKDGVEVGEGDVVSIDGTTGAVFEGEIEVTASPVAEYFEGRLEPDGEEADDLIRAVHRIVAHADDRRRLEVHANADTRDDAERARRFGATGIGLCRTEHMFLGERRQHVEDLILAESQEDRDKALDELVPLQRDDFTAILEAMDGLPVTIRLIDPPLHEFLPDLTDLSVKVALAEERGEDDEGDRRLLRAVERMHEQNPMLGLRGVRLGLIVPGLVAMQVRAIAEAARSRREAGGDPRPEIMIPLIGGVEEFDLMSEEIRRVLEDVEEASGVSIPARIGTMIELPRAALTAGPIAAHADFFSFGTNDLTQTAWGFSRDDVEGAFFTAYLEMGVFPVSPFESLDEEGVGRLVSIAVEEGRAVSAELTIGVCGEHGGDPSSIAFFHRAGLDYVSCSPFRVPIARLEAGRAAVAGGKDSSDSR
jgi:pyruvate,orthophosphate dikinase